MVRSTRLGVDPENSGLRPATVCTLCCFELLAQLSVLQSRKFLLLLALQPMPGPRVCEFAVILEPERINLGLQLLRLLQSLECCVPPASLITLLLGQSGGIALRTRSLTASCVALFLRCFMRASTN